MNPYTILGITPEATVEEVKKAYSGLLREHRPDTDPEGFQTIRSAYESICASLKKGSVAKAVYGNFRERETDESSQPESEPKEESVHRSDLKHLDSIHPSSSMPFAELTEGQINTLVATALAKINWQYNQIPGRIFLENWKRLLQNEAFWYPQVKQRMSESILHFLLGHPYLPLNIWQLWDAEFEWSSVVSTSTNFHLQKNGEMLQALLSELNPKFAFDYTIGIPAEVLEKGVPISDQSRKKYEKFCANRYAYKKFFQVGKIREAESAFQNSIATFPDDVSLYQSCLLSAAHIFDPNQPLAEYKHLTHVYYQSVQFLLRRFPDNPQYQKARADYFLITRNFSKAKKQYEKYAADNPHDIEPLLRIAIIRTIRGPVGPNRHYKELLARHTGIQQELLVMKTDPDKGQFAAQMFDKNEKHLAMFFSDSRVKKVIARRQSEKILVVVVSLAIFTICLFGVIISLISS